MKSELKSIAMLVLLTSVLSIVGCSSSRNNDNGTVVEKKADRAKTTAERRLDQHTDSKINRAIDGLFK